MRFPKMSLLRGPESCDTFVVLPSFTKNGDIIFGKNSDRPQKEVQEVVYVKGRLREPQLKCTYITIDESSEPINDVALSKPAWMWGAEMGSNDKNVVIGNEAVWTNNNEGEGDARHKRLLGMDLVRLGLERGNTAEEALNVITNLLEKYGQGGPCSEYDDSLYYHNSFLIADTKEAWVLETSGRLWVAEKLKSGYRNISNGLTITTQIDKHCQGLHERTIKLGLWDGQGEFNFTKCYTAGGDDERQRAGERLLKEATKHSSFAVKDMFDILRHKDSRICRSCDDGFPTQASQVSSLSNKGLSVHWFTGTPDASVSLFKPFIFVDNVKMSSFTESPHEGHREHYLYKLHYQYLKVYGENKIYSDLHTLEEEWLSKTTEIMEHGADQVPHDVENLFKDATEAEVNLYRQN